MTLASNKVQVGTRVSFAGYIIDGTTQYPDPKKVEATREYREQEEDEFRVQMGGEVNLEEQQQGGEKQRRRGRNRNVEDVEPRRSSRLAKKKVTVGDSEKEDNREELPYYMEAVETG